MKINMLINVQMPTTVGILTFISMINTKVESLKTTFKNFIFQRAGAISSFVELSIFYNLGARTVSLKVVLPINRKYRLLSDDYNCELSIEFLLSIILM